jgi:hypothetical protein
MGALAREHVLRHYSVESMTSAYERLYWDLVAANTSRDPS